MCQAFDDEKILEYLLGRLTPDECSEFESHLSSCPSCQKALEELRPVADFSEAYPVQTGPGLDSRVKESASRLSRRWRERPDTRAARETATASPLQSAIRWGMWLSVAACLAIVAGSMVYNAYRARTFPRRLIAHVASTSPDVIVYRGDESVVAAVGMDILPGDRIETGKGQGTGIAYRNEDTAVDIRENTRLTFGRGPDGAGQSPAAASGRALYLETGEIQSRVAPQPSGEPMVVQTPHAEVKVRGTVFSVATDAHFTRVEVRVGQVELRTRASGTTLDVAAGQSAATDGGPDIVVGARRPDGAIVFFDGSDTSLWMCHPPMRIPTAAELENPRPCHWQVVDGALVVVPGHLITKRMFQDFKLHVEFRIPPKRSVDSGVWLQYRYGVQIRSKSEPDSTVGTGGLYRFKAPDHDVIKPDGTWQSFDITFRAARFDEAGKKTENARLSVFLNGVRIHNDVELPARTKTLREPEGPTPGPIVLEGMFSSAGVRFRNIWVVPL